MSGRRDGLTLINILCYSHHSEVHFPVFWACGCNTPASDIACNCCNDSCNCCNLPGASGAFCIHMPQCLDQKKRSLPMSDPRKPRHGCIAARPTSGYQVTASLREERQQRIRTRRSHHITSCHTMLHSLVVMLNCGFSCCLVQDGELHALLSYCKTIIICLRAMETPGDAASLAVTRKI